MKIQTSQFGEVHVLTNCPLLSSLAVSPAINAQRNNIENICYMGLYRFDADQIEFQFLGAGISQVTIPILELES